MAFGSMTAVVFGGGGFVGRHLFHLGNDRVPHRDLVLGKIEQLGIEFG